MTSSAPTIGRPSEIPDEKIIEAGAHIAASGARVTGFALRKILGAGAPKRLMAVWNRHCGDVDPMTVSGAGVVLPSEVVGATEEAVKSASAQIMKIALAAFSAASRGAEQRVKSALEEAAIDRQRFDEEMDDAASQIERQDGTIEAQAGRIAELESKLSAQAAQLANLGLVERELTKSQADLAALRNENTELSTNLAAALAKLDGERSSVAALRQELATSQKNAASQRDEVDALKTTAATALARQEDAQARVAALEHQLHDMQRTNASMEAANTALAAELSSCSARSSDVARKLAACSARNDDLVSEVSALRIAMQKNEDAVAHLADVEAQLQQQRGRNMTLDGMLKNTQQQILDLQTRLNASR